MCDVVSVPLPSFVREQWRPPARTQAMVGPSSLSNVRLSTVPPEFI